MKKLNLKDKVNFAGVEWTAFKITENGDVYVLMNTPYKKSGFGKSNDYRSSDIRADLLNGEILYRIKKELGEDALLPITLDLTSLDGWKDYGVTKGDELSLLNLDLFREGREHIQVCESFWLATSDSTPSGIGSGYVLCVKSGGNVDCGSCSWGAVGVRPFCILSSSIFESDTANC